MEVNAKFETFPIASQVQDSGGVVLVDVGGNKGHDLKLFQAAHPKLDWKLILQDLPDVVKQNDQALLEGIEIMPYDFFTSQPVQGRKVPALRLSNQLTLRS